MTRYTTMLQCLSRALSLRVVPLPISRYKNLSDIFTRNDTILDYATMSILSVVTSSDIRHRRNRTEK
ncbi:hypothetical protein N9595_02015 [Bacteroidia bacterium]|nr:hypothetical protein [Bacteroidia bacterium]